MPITMITPGNTVTILRITGNDETRHRLFEMGFVVGDQVKIIANNSGSLIVQVKEGRIALDMKIANRVLAA